MRQMILCLSLFLGGCYTPEYLFVTHTKHGVCERREIINRKTLASRRVEVLPLGYCDGFIAVTPEDFAKIRGKDKK